MKIETAQQHIGQTCRVNYEIPIPSEKQTEDKFGVKNWVRYIAHIPHKRTGIVTNVTFRKLILLAFNGEIDDFEYYIELKHIKQIYELKT